MCFSNVVMYFIILTTAATLHAHGQTTITTARQAAEALRPLAGDAAYWLFTLGLIGTGMLGVRSSRAPAPIPLRKPRHGAGRSTPRLAWRGSSTPWWPCRWGSG